MQKSGYVTIDFCHDKILITTSGGSGGGGGGGGLLEEGCVWEEIWYTFYQLLGRTW